MRDFFLIIKGHINENTKVRRPYHIFSIRLFLADSLLENCLLSYLYLINKFALLRHNSIYNRKPLLLKFL